MYAFRCRTLVAVMLFASLGGCAGVVMHPQIITRTTETVPEVAGVAASITSVVTKPASHAARPSKVEARAPVAPLEENFWVDLVAARRFTDCNYDPAIEGWAKRLTQNPANFNANLARIQPYLDYVWRRTQALQMPSEVAFLPLVESDYRQVYGSYGSPGGWWQLMPETARGYRLEVTRANDERIDPIKSTDVALKLMQENADRFDNDWLLAIFAYNVGGQRVERLLSAKGIQPGQLEYVQQLGLPLTTENHLHRLIAWGCIFADPTRYQVTLPEPLLAAQRLTEVRLDQTTPVAAMLATLESFGPEWKNQHPLIAKKGEIRADQSVLAPPQTIAALAALGDLQRFKSSAPVVAVVSKPNTVGPRNNAVANRARRGVVATAARAQSRILAAKVSTGKVSTGKVSAPQSFKVRNGDNLWTIARRFDMRVNDILALNPGVSRSTALKLGHVLRLK